jgi:protein-tyrosine-phosphatase
MPLSHLPGSVLFACTWNAIRSPMAEGLLKHLHGRRIYVDSVGVRANPIDPFVVEVMQELGIDLARHRPKTFDDLADSSFDVVVTLSPEAQHKAVEMTRIMACDVEYWPSFDPSLTEGSRDAMLESYRAVRDHLARRLRTRFPPPALPDL